MLFICDTLITRIVVEVKQKVKEIMEFLKMKEVIVILIILAIILVAYFVFWLIDFMKSRESKKILKNKPISMH